MQLNPRNYISDPALPEPISNVTYAFCPRVDELQAFNITNVGQLAYTYIANNGSIEFMDVDQIYLSVIGFGDTSNINYPQSESEGRVMIGDYFSQAGDQGTPQCEVNNQIAVVPFLVLNISLDGGKFKYYDGHPQPAGVGFVPSCDAYDVCLFDSTSKCIGTAGRRNCATCVTREEAATQGLQIWASYYGTDASGRQLRSGASNPLNFQAYSGSGVSSSMRRSFNDVQAGRSVNNDGLDPGRRQTE